MTRRYPMYDHIRAEPRARPPKGGQDHGSTLKSHT